MVEALPRSQGVRVVPTASMIVASTALRTSCDATTVSSPAQTDLAINLEMEADQDLISTPSLCVDDFS
ncbi:uncharacterized protein MEPE_01949 [Melanopsichium pennsylvanicum]|uniref:Uncharacterized protein n=1 Tax=Melanopsichium pennsylvanicum TaxID=63383 RepID=A0AAJ4XLE8_9BASI|nr:uncharacterized protein MEPE_01949 [Melanopsichium pennsylvanicum]